MVREDYFVFGLETRLKNLDFSIALCVYGPKFADYKKGLIAVGIIGVREPYI